MRPAEVSPCTCVEVKALTWSVLMAATEPVLSAPTCLAVNEATWPVLNWATAAVVNTAT